MTIRDLAEDLLWCLSKHEDKPHKLWITLQTIIRAYGEPGAERDTAVELLESLAKKEVQW